MWERRVCSELNSGLPINLSQEFPSFMVDISHAAKIDGQLFLMHGRSERCHVRSNSAAHGLATLPLSLRIIVFALFWMSVRLGD
jgi:hypothetical protein